MKLKFIFMIACLFVSYSQCARVKVTSGSKAFSYDNIYAEARSRTIFIFEVFRPHIMEEVARVHTPLPIRSIFVVKNRYLIVHCRLGSIIRLFAWDIENPLLPIKILIRQ